ncbi:MAG: hypothetical protein LBK22_06890, partial [Tannerella sp.]|nr:hypothetical protein [Tannerella sp.]
MRTRHDWLPFNHEDIYNKAAQTIAYLTAAVFARIGIAGAALTWYQNIFMVQYNKFKTAYENWRNQADRTQIKTTMLQEAENDFVKVYRKLYTGYIKENPLVTDDDLQSCGFPKRHTGGNTPVRKPDSLIDMKADTSKPAVVRIHYRDAESEGTAKPEGVHGAEFKTAVIPKDQPVPEDWAELTESTFDTGTPATFTFSGKQRGMKFCFAS